MEIHSTFIINGIPVELGPPNNGMRGFIDSEIDKNGYCDIIVLSRENGVISNTPVGKGTCHTMFLTEDKGEDLIDGLNNILNQREARHNEIMAKHYLKKIIDEEE